MTDRVSSANNPRNTSLDRGLPGSTPADTSGLEQAARDFAQLMEPSSTSESPRSPSDTEEVSSGTTDRPCEADGGQRKQVEERKEGHRGDSSDDSSHQGEEPMKGAEDDLQRLMASAGDSILQAFSKPPVEQVAVADAIQGPNWDGVIQQIADKILVSDPMHTQGATEVRIVLKDSILPGTEVRIVQEAGRLQIQLVTDSPESRSVLMNNQAALQERLNEKLSDKQVVVEVAFEGDAQGEAGDGRSRQRRNLQDEYERQ